MIIVYKEQFAIIAVFIKQCSYKRQKLGDNEVFAEMYDLFIHVKYVRVV
jgi:hypothetical protein